VLRGRRLLPCVVNLVNQVLTVLVLHARLQLVLEQLPGRDQKGTGSVTTHHIWAELAGKRALCRHIFEAHVIGLLRHALRTLVHCFCALGLPTPDLVVNLRLVLVNTPLLCLHGLYRRT
jgi:hypothetical protein